MDWRAVLTRFAILFGGRYQQVNKYIIEINVAVDKIVLIFLVI